MIPLLQTIVDRLLGWPVAVVILALIFKRSLGGLVARIDLFKLKGAGVEGELSVGKAFAQIEAAERKAEQQDPLALSPSSQQPDLPLPESIASRRDFVRHYGGEDPVVLNQIQMVHDDLIALQFPLNSPETTDVLIRHLAVAQLLHRGEFLYRLIFGSQLAAMRKMNEAGPQLEAEIRPFFERARARSPRFYGDYTFEQWVTFLIQQRAVVRANDRYAITLAGREFLGFVTRQGLPRKAH